MRKLTTITAASSVAVGGLFVAGALLPASAETATKPDTATTAGDSSLADRLTRLKEALAGLVDDGTLTQEKADTIAATLNDSEALGPQEFGRRMHDDAGPLPFESAGEVLGLTAEEMRDALRSGSSLADLAEQQGVDVGTLVDALVAVATERIDTAVAAGDLEQDRADELKAQLEERVTAVVDEVPALHHRGGGMHGRSGNPGTTPDEDATSTTLRGAVDRVLQTV
ncbi:MAG: hypothetical protein ACYC1Z_04565 [Georgenia sp.]